MLRRSEIEVREVLLEYDGPQIITARDFYGASYLCVAIPHRTPGMFFGARIAADELQQFNAGRIDLHYALTYQRKPKQVTFVYDGSRSVVPVSRHMGTIPAEWLPDRGFFWEAEEVAPTAVQATNEVAIAIDGRWDIEDLADFPQKLAAPYAFLHALMRRAGDAAGRVLASFQRYPWRGGFSTVFFYRDLYGMVPRAERVTVQRIKYASPGEMVLQASQPVMAELHRSLSVIDPASARVAYRDLHREMSNRTLLGRSTQEVSVDEETLAILREGCTTLSDAIGFRFLDDLYETTGRSHVLSAKLLLAYYRRLEDLAAFYDSGKAEYRGQVTSGVPVSGEPE